MSLNIYILHLLIYNINNNNITVIICNEFCNTNYTTCYCFDTESFNFIWADLSELNMREKAMK